MNLYTIFDEKADFFSNPFAARTDAEATRSFREALADPNTIFAKSPRDFILYKTAEFDSNTGHTEGLAMPKHIVDAMSLVSPINQVQE